MFTLNQDIEIIERCYIDKLPMDMVEDYFASLGATVNPDMVKDVYYDMNSKETDAILDSY